MRTERGGSISTLTTNCCAASSVARRVGGGGSLPVAAALRSVIGVRAPRRVLRACGVGAPRSSGRGAQQAVKRGAHVPDVLGVGSAAAADDARAAVEEAADWAPK